MVLRVFVGIFMPIFKLIKKLRAWFGFKLFRFKKRTGALLKAKRQAKKALKQQKSKEVRACRRKRIIKTKKA